MLPDPALAVAFLAELVPDGERVLELAIGTGRVAVHLAQQGIAVEGIDGSAAMDLMAKLAGLRLRERYNDWDRSPFTASSGQHISVYERV